MADLLAGPNRILADLPRQQFDRQPAGMAAADEGLQSHMLSATEIQQLNSPEWDALSANAVAENPFYARYFVKGGLATIDARTGIRAFCMRSDDGRLIGFFPFTSRFGFARTATNLYQFTGVPLVHRDFAQSAIEHWMSAIKRGDAPRCWQFDNFPLHGELYQAILRAAEKHGLCCITRNPYQRPQLTRLADGFEAHLSTVLSKSRRKELDRCLRRLKERGMLHLDRAETPDTVAAALEAYLQLEDRGWKGKAGTSFLAHGKDAEFARAAFRNSGSANGAMIDSLLLDGRPIAISVNLAGASTLFTPKCTYDEALRSFAPGLVLEYLVIERFYRDPRFSRMDAATTVDGHVIQGLWNGSVPMGTLIVGPAALARPRAWFVVSRSKAKAAVKRGIRLIKALRPGMGSHLSITSSLGRRSTN
jgi:CelD/BcsL family acetyltransferase involved in cellulose biosynthesis